MSRRATLLLLLFLEFSHQLASLSPGQKRRAKKREYWEQHKAVEPAPRRQPLPAVRKRDSLDTLSPDLPPPRQSPPADSWRALRRHEDLPPPRQSPPADSSRALRRHEDLPPPRQSPPADSWRALRRLVDAPPPATPPRPLSQGERLMVQVLSFSPLGMSLRTVDGGLAALSYHDDAQYHSTPPRPADVLAATVVKQRDDGKLDVTFRPLGAVARIDEAAAAVLAALLEAAAHATEDASLPLGDASEPEEVRARLGVSKASFKAALGRLLKMRLLDAPLQPRKTVLSTELTQRIASSLQKDLPSVLSELWPPELPRPADAATAPRVVELRALAEESAGSAYVSLERLPPWLFTLDADDEPPSPSTRAASALLQLLAPYGRVHALRGLLSADGRPSGRCIAQFSSAAEAASAVDGLRAQGVPISPFSEAREAPRHRTHAASAAAEAVERCRVFVGNLHPQATEDDLWDLFLDCGYITEVSLAKADDGISCKGFGHVQFSEVAGARAAVALSPRLDGRPVRVELARARTDARRQAAPRAAGGGARGAERKGLRREPRTEGMSRAGLGARGDGAGWLGRRSAG